MVPTNMIIEQNGQIRNDEDNLNMWSLTLGATVSELLVMPDVELQERLDRVTRQLSCTKEGKFDNVFAQLGIRKRAGAGRDLCDESPPPGFYECSMVSDDGVYSLSDETPPPGWYDESSESHISNETPPEAFYGADESAGGHYGFDEENDQYNEWNNNFDSAEFGIGNAFDDTRSSLGVIHSPGQSGSLVRVRSNAHLAGDQAAIDCARQKHERVFNLLESRPGKAVVRDIQRAIKRSLNRSRDSRYDSNEFGIGHDFGENTSGGAEQLVYSDASRDPNYNSGEFECENSSGPSPGSNRGPQNVARDNANKGFQRCQAPEEGGASSGEGSFYMSFASGANVQSSPYRRRS